MRGGGSRRRRGGFAGRGAGVPPGMDEKPLGAGAVPAYCSSMLMKLLGSGATALVLAGCAAQLNSGAKRPVERPVFVQYLPGQAAKYPLHSAYEGVLTQRGPCLGVVRDGRFSTLIWPDTARIAFGRGGLEVAEAGHAPVRPGDRIEFTGGPLPAEMTHALGGDVLSVDMPIECARYPGYNGWIAIVNPGFRRAP